VKEGYEMTAVLRLEKMNEKTRGEVLELVSRCNAHDGTRSELKIDEGINFHPDMATTFLIYEGETLESFMHLMAITATEIEISGYTLPEARGKGHFKALREAVFREARRLGYHKAVYVIDTNSLEGLEWTKKKHLTYEYTEVSMFLANPSIKEKINDKIHCRVLEKAGLPLALDIHNKIFDLDPVAAEGYLNRLLEDPQRHFHIFYYEETPIGLGGIQYGDDRAILFGVGILKDYRGRGYSRQLMQRLMGKIKEQGISRILLEVNQDNQVAYEAYKKLGFIDAYAMSYYSETIPSSES
jgi:GNAT superfamily N-acetyltransferase